MAKVSYVAVPPDLAGKYAQNFAPLYKTKNSSIRWLGGIPSRRKVNNVSGRSLLPQIAELWAGLDSSVKSNWAAAGAASGYNGYSQFVQDTARRIQLGISGLATPSTLHQYKVGEILVESPATGFSITQIHPVIYYQMKKVTGTKSQREPVAVQEILSLPFEFGLSYRTNLTSVGDGAYCKAYARIHYNYRAELLTKDIGFELPFISDWARQTTTLQSLDAPPRWYSLFVELYNCRGTVQFDLLTAKHGGVNYGRDFRCTNIDSGFSDYNYQLPASWESTAAVDGASFGSVYPSDGSL